MTPLLICVVIMTIFCMKKGEEKTPNNMNHKISRITHERQMLFGETCLVTDIIEE